ncbi:MAG: ATP-binding protein [Planctomycetota bacterium]|jgi:predicted AAA+ superfamily ATPase
MYRKLRDRIIKDLESKMVLLTGPRQVGKTWLSHNIAENYNSNTYLNYDNYQDKKIIDDMTWMKNHELIIFDELHKKKDWKNYLKGVYDTKPEHQKILVTGSARLETFRQMGDSLAGRFFLHRLMPFTPGEISEKTPDLIEHLLERGGFPEPFLAADKVDSERWRLQYSESLIRTDLQDLGKIQDLRLAQLIMEMLRHRVGSPVSYRSIAEDVQASPNTVKRYIELLESLFVIFRIVPHSKNIARSLLREPKLYFFDTGMVFENEGARLENLVAVSLYKHILGRRDCLGENTSLNYLRTKDGKEVDFCLVKDNIPEKMIEVKTTDSKTHKALKNFNTKYNIPGIQLIKNLRVEESRDNLEFLNVESYLKNLDFA